MQLSLATTRSAEFSPCRRYRYTLRIVWEPSLPLLVVVGLNPSTADESKDDPTLRRVQGFARDMGRGGVLMLNFFAWRETNSALLRQVAEPVGAENTPENFWRWIQSAGGLRPVAAWGTKAKQLDPARWEMLRRSTRFDCFRTTKDGEPEHPLYLPADLRPRQWNYGEGV